MPTKDFWDYQVTQQFGPTNVVEDSPYGGYLHFNKGLDFGAPIGTPVRALVGGIVASAGEAGDGWGTRVWVRDDQGNVHNYGHLSQANVSAGATVRAGDLLGLSGNSGRSTGPHVSYDVWDTRSQYIDPSRFVWPDPPGQEVGPNGRTVRQITGTNYLSVREQMWFLDRIGRRDLITPAMAGAAFAEAPPMGGGAATATPPPAPAEEVGPSGRTVRQSTGTEYLSFREQVWYLEKMGRRDLITAEMRAAAAGEGH